MSDRSQQATAITPSCTTQHPSRSQLRLVRSIPVVLMSYIGRGREFRCESCGTTTPGTRAQLIKFVRFGWTMIRCRTCGSEGKAKVSHHTKEK